MTEEPKFYQMLYSKMYNEKSIPVPVVFIKLHARIKYNKNALANKYWVRYDQNYVFVSGA